MTPDHGNLADPDYEPTDEELRELSRTAFAEVAVRNREALARVHAEIAARSAELVARLAASASPESGG